ncbi:hypothetical protein CCACVL1_22645 [Corchorus capsularis]|uniref:Uncharacterized protein n=1 Tax=Corchorus capsularis TaxID=210143 RepID=A0A1R3GXL9_COCAP|nr:hypothetical protein CCACVL1_22645 [Corchorus capsularis]
MTGCLSHKIGKAELLAEAVRRRFEPNSGLWPGIVM